MKKQILKIPRQIQHKKRSAPNAYISLPKPHHALSTRAYYLRTCFSFMVNLAPAHWPSPEGLRPNTNRVARFPIHLDPNRAPTVAISLEFSVFKCHMVFPASVDFVLENCNLFFSIVTCSRERKREEKETELKRRERNRAKEKRKKQS
nr:hypothetical protein BgiMline_010148 [Biomphalaria glabrata]